MNIISVVIPVYNAGLHLRACLDSLLAQTYSHYELILINDGSVDDSASICNEYARKDNRISVYHQANLGVSVARNRGISYANGKYLSFVDADDRVGEFYLVNLLASLSHKGGKGVVIGGLINIYSDGSSQHLEVPDREYRNKDIGHVFTDINLHKYWYTMSKLYDLSLIRNNHIQFDERLSYAEDALFLMEYLKWTEYVRFTPTNDYYYIHHEGESLSRSNRTYKAEITVYRAMIENLDDIRRRYHYPVSLLENMRNEFSVYLIHSLSALYRPPYTLKRRERLEALKVLGEEDFNLLRNNYYPVRLVDKIGKALLMKHYKILYDTFMSFCFTVHYRLMSKFGK